MPVMNLIDWRRKQGLTLHECAARFAISSARTYQRYETGENRPSAVMTDRIVAATDGAVTAIDLHEIRLAWELANAPQVLLA